MPVTSPAPTKAPRPGEKAGISRVTSAAATVEAPTNSESWPALSAASTHRPPAVPATRPPVIQRAPVPSIAPRSRQAT